MAVDCLLNLVFNGAHLFTHCSALFASSEWCSHRFGSFESLDVFHFVFPVTKPANIKEFVF